MNTGQIIKSKTTEKFTVIPNLLLRDNTMSLKAKGLLALLLSLPVDWVIYKTQVHQFSSDGRTSACSAFDELIKSGYIVSVEIRDKAGKFMGFNYVVYDTSITPAENQQKQKSIISGSEIPPCLKPEIGKPEIGKPDTNKERYHTNKDYTKKDIPALSEFLEHAKAACTKAKLNYNELQFSIESKYETWVADGWKDGNGKLIRIWKTKFNNTLPHLKAIQSQPGRSGQQVERGNFLES